MATINTKGGAVAALLAALLVIPAVAAERKLFTLESSPKAVELEVLDVPGAQLAKSAVPSRTWKLEPGEQVPRDQARPSDRVVELYTGTLQAPSLLCRVALRYFPSPAGWTPHFRLEDEPLVAKINGRWQPFELTRGAGAALVRLGNTLPNAEGFFPDLEFGLSAGSLPIVAWQVR